MLSNFNHGKDVIKRNGAFKKPLLDDETSTYSMGMPLLCVKKVETAQSVIKMPNITLSVQLGVAIYELNSDAIE